MTQPILIASERGEVGLAAGMAILRAGGSALDAVETAVRAVEANEDDHHVGVGGLPNLLGEVELDASIMDGATRHAGAVAAVTGFPHPISIARAICDRLPQHVMLVGPGAERFADEAGIERGPTLTEEARQVLLALAAAGQEPAQACATALTEIADLPDEFRSTLQCLCLTPDGRHGGASTKAGATYAVLTAADDGYRIVERRQA
jgi:isoaspartyl peptidase/L-asparaginase-like protein (Ntn-hydrolase superfamily)